MASKDFAQPELVRRLSLVSIVRIGHKVIFSVSRQSYRMLLDSLHCGDILFKVEYS